MPNNSRLYREKQRKKTRYSSDSDSEREKSRKYREKAYKSKDRRSRERSSGTSRHKTRKRYSSSSSSSASSRSSSSSSSSSSGREKTSSKRDKRSSRSSSKFDHITKFEINDLYKEEDKVKIIDSIDAESFKQETFQSKGGKKIVMHKDKILVPTTLAAADQEDESLIHPSFLGDEEGKVDKWIKKLHLYRNQ